MGSESRDHLDIESLNPDPNPGSDSEERLGPKRKFLSIHFRCCSTYGRLYINRQKTHYEGRCPRCGARTSARIGPGGSGQRLFGAS